MKDTASRAVALLNSLGFARQSTKRDRGTKWNNSNQRQYRFFRTAYSRAVNLFYECAPDCSAHRRQLKPLPFLLCPKTLHCLWRTDFRLHKAAGLLPVVSDSYEQLYPDASLPLFEMYLQPVGRINYLGTLFVWRTNLCLDPCHVSIAMKELVQAAKNHAYLAEA